MVNNAYLKNWKQVAEGIYNYTDNGQTIAEFVLYEDGTGVLNITLQPKNVLERRYRIEDSISIRKAPINEMLTEATKEIYYLISKIVSFLGSFLPENK